MQTTSQFKTTPQFKTTTLFNPYKYIAGWKALGIGWAIILVTACIASRGNTHFDGVLDAHSGLVTPFAWYLLDPLVAWALAMVIFYLAALLFSASSVRLIDIAGTMALARAPMIFAALILLSLPAIPPIKSASDLHNISGAIILIGFAASVFSIWMIALMYNAFSVSANLKGSKAGWVFVAALILGEILSKIAFYLLYRHMA